MPQNQNKNSKVALNPLSSEAALKEREELTLTTKEKEKRAN